MLTWVRSSGAAQRVRLWLILGRQGEVSVRACVRAYVRVCVCVCVRVYVCGGARASARRELGGSQAGINMPGMPRRAGCSPRT